MWHLGDSTNNTLEEEILRHADLLLSTINPAVLPDGSNIIDARAPKVDPHICNKAYGDIHDFNNDLADLVASTPVAQPPIDFTPSMTNRSNPLNTPSLYNPTQSLSAEDDPTLLTARNNGMINSFNRVQLSPWQANVVMQYIVSRQRVLQYCT